MIFNALLKLIAHPDGFQEIRKRSR